MPTFQLKLSDTDEYEILDDRGQQLINLPSMLRYETDTAHLCDVLEHLVRFMVVKNLHNPMPSTAFRSSFAIEVIKDGMVFGADEEIKMRHKQSATIIMRNKGDKELFAFVYNLGSRWQVEAILHKSYESIAPQTGPRNDDLGTGTYSWKVTFIVPPSMIEHGHCEDIIKIFITSQPTYLGSLEMPKLGMSQTKARSRTSYSHRDGSEDWVTVVFPFRTSI